MADAPRPPAPGPLWSRARDPQFAFLAGVNLYTLQAAHSIVRSLPVGREEIAHWQSHALEDLRGFYRERTKPDLVAQKITEYANRVSRKPRWHALFRRPLLPEVELRMAAYLLTDFAGVLRGGQPEPARLASMWGCLSLLDSKFEKKLGLRRARPHTTAVNYHNRNDILPLGLEIGAFGGYRWFELDC